MLIQIITNLDNGAGLQQDYHLFAGICREMGHRVRAVHIHNIGAANRADLNVFLEVLVPGAMRFAPRNWVVPNSEWWGAHWNDHLQHIDRVLCKTRDCLELWKGKHARAVFTGWAAQDLYVPTIPKEAKFLHTAGKSQTKNTAAVTEAWRRFNLPYPLTVVAFKPEIQRLAEGVQNVRLISRFTESQLQHELNSSRFFIMPSKYEGYGHAIHEALGAQSVVITTNGEPMRSFAGVPSALLVQTVQDHKMGEATAHLVSITALANTVKKAAEMHEDELTRIGVAARAGFLADNAFFHGEIRRQLRGI